jgi:hypothetical protein
MDNIQLWSDVAVDVQTALGPAKTITAISKADPAVASAATHGFEEGDYLLLKIQGMRELNYAVARVADPDTGTFALEGVDSTLFATFISGTAEKITFGASADTITEVSAAGGEADKQLVQTIHTRRGFNIPGNESPLVFTLGSLWLPNDPVLKAFNAAGRTRSIRAVRFGFADGAEVLFSGYPTASLAPNGSAGQAVTTPASIDVRGLLLPYAAPAA